MGKPFSIKLARKAREKEIKLSEKLKSLFKQLKPELGPGKNHDIELFYGQRKVAALEVEVVRQDRWEKIKGEYPTARWPIGKKRYAEDIVPVFMTSVCDDLSDILAIDAKTWVLEGKEERAPFVRAGGQPIRYRKGQEEPFWAIDKSKAHWGFEGLEDYIIKKLEMKPK